MKEAWLKGADKVCGWTKGPPRHKETWWWNDTVQSAVEEKRARYNDWKKLGDIEDHTRYKEGKKVPRPDVWKAKEVKREEFTEDLHTEAGKKRVFKVAKQMVKEREEIHGAFCMKDEHDNIKTEAEEIKTIWRSYMEKLLNIENDWDQDTTSDTLQGPHCQIRTEEVRKALSSTVQGKAGGPTGVVTEMLAAGGVEEIFLPCDSYPRHGRKSVYRLCMEQPRSVSHPLILQGNATSTSTFDCTEM